jgi:AraC-like DNA-binding protein
MKTEAPSIRTPTVRGFVLAARAAGADADALIARYGLPVDVERMPDLYLRVSVLRALADEVATLLGAPFIGLHLAMLVNRGEFGLFEFILRSASTVRHACRLAVRYSALINEVPRISFAENETEGTLDDRIPGEPLCAGAQVNEFTMAVVVRLIREAANPDWHPRRVWLAHHREADRSPLVSFFGTPQIAFGAGSNGLGFELADLDMPILTADDALRNVLEAQAKAAIAQSPTKGDVLTRMREHIRANLLDGPPSLESIAAALGLAERTLQRRLAEANTTWSAVIDDVRSTLARLYLADPDRSLGDVAFLVGYSDLSSFMRAFKRWSGTTPGKYRERNLTRA